MTVNQIEQMYAEYTYAFEQGQISKEEYKNLLEGLEIEQAMSATAEELQKKQYLYQAITAAIAIASTVA